MSTNLDIQLSEHVFSVLSNAASEAGKTPGELAAAVVESVYSDSRAALPDAAIARTRFEQCFGSIDLGLPIGLANDGIDADLARQYGSTGS